MNNGHRVVTNNAGFTISTDKHFLDVETIYHFLHDESYWAKEITRELVETTIQNSVLCYGIYDGNPEEGARQVGFARVVSDLVRFAWLGDVFIIPEYRGRGLGKWLIDTITNNPNLKGVSFQLATGDAHSLYAQYGFHPLDQVERKMERSINWAKIYEGYGIEK
jgi:GNAT superfamily N-acetyltransferase